MAAWTTNILSIAYDDFAKIKITARTIKMTDQIKNLLEQLYKFDKR